MADIARARVPVVFDESQIAQDAKSSITGALKRVAIDAASLAIGKQILDIGVSGLDELKEAQAVQAQTAAGIRSTGGAANATAEEVGGLAQRLSDLSGVDDELIQRGENLLLTFRAVHNEVGAGNNIFDRATQAALDLSARGFGSVESASIQLGKALEDPITGLTALRRSGIQFSESQQATIKALVESGQQLEAQKVILKEIETQVGGSAAAYGQTLPGSIDRARESIKNAEADLVEGFAPAVTFGAEAIVGLSDAVQSLPPGLQAIAGGLVFIGGGAAALINPVTDVIRLFTVLKESRLAAAAQVAAADAAEAVASTQKVAKTGQEIAVTGVLTEAQVRLIVSNERLAFTDNEVALAKARRIVSNEALIASEQALIATEIAATEANAGLATSSAGLSAALGPIGVALGAITLGVALFGQHTSQFETTLTQFSSGLSGGLDELNSKADVTAAITKQLDDSLRGDGGLAGAFANAGISSKEFVEALQLGDADFIKRLDLNQAETLALAKLAQATEDSARNAINAAVASGSLDKSQADAATSTNRLSDGTVNYVAALSSLVDNGLIAKSVLDGITGSLTTQQQALEEMQQTVLAAEQAQQQLIPAQLSAESAALAVADAQDRLREAQLDATKGIAEQQIALERAVDNARRKLEEAERAADSGRLAADAAHRQSEISQAEIALRQAQIELNRARTPDQLLQAQKDLLAAQDRLAQATQEQADHANDAEQAQRDLADAQQALVEAQQAEIDLADTIADKQRAVERARLGVEQAVINQAQALSNLQVLQDASIGKITTEGEKTDIFLQNLKGLNDTLTGPAHAALDSYISDLERLDDALQDIIDKFNSEILKNPPPNTFDEEGRLVHPTGAPPLITRASGGPVGAYQPFFGAERGFEVALLRDKGLYQFSEPVQILDHDTSAGLLGGGRGGVNVASGAIQVVAANPREGLELALSEMAWQLVNR